MKVICGMCQEELPEIGADHWCEEKARFGAFLSTGDADWLRGDDDE